MTTQTLSPPELSTLRIEIDGEIGTLTLDRPDVFNAMSPEMIGEFTVAFGWLADRAPLRALIVTGTGRAFSAGGDVNWFREGVESDEHDLPSEVRRGAEVLHQAIVDLRRIPYPVIAAVNGAAAGAGFSLALACDIRIAADSAFFAPAYGRIGASPVCASAVSSRSSGCCTTEAGRASRVCWTRSSRSGWQTTRGRWRSATRGWMRTRRSTSR